MNDHYKLWIAKAEEDIQTVEILIKEEKYPPSVVCFHCQQSAEKYLKAYLTAYNVELPKIHDLVEILEKLCYPINNDFEQIKEDALQLTDYGVAPRYPDYLFEPSIKDAEEAYHSALKIKEFVIARLK